jgi:pimeloyl-ACP methyl ester carboxylesterase
MALNRPDFTRGLVLIAPVSHPWGGGVTWYYRIATARIVGRAFNWLIMPWVALIYMPWGLKSVFSPQPTPHDYIQRTRLKLLLRPRHFRANAEDVVDIEAHVNRLHARYNEIRVPTAVVTGDHDAVVYTHIHSVSCARDISGATLVTLEGVGHSPHYADPDAVVAAILDVDARAHRARDKTREPVESAPL